MTLGESFGNVGYVQGDTAVELPSGSWTLTIGSTDIQFAGGSENRDGNHYVFAATGAMPVVGSAVTVSLLVPAPTITVSAEKSTYV